MQYTCKYYYLRSSRVQAGKTSRHALLTDTALYCSLTWDCSAHCTYVVARISTAHAQYCARTNFPYYLIYLSSPCLSLSPRPQTNPTMDHFQYHTLSVSHTFSITHFQYHTQEKVLCCDTGSTECMRSGDETPVRKKMEVTCFPIEFSWQPCIVIGKELVLKQFRSNLLQDRLFNMSYQKKNSGRCYNVSS